MSLKRQLKNFFIKTNSLWILDRLNYYFALLRYSTANKKFQKSNPDFLFPPNYYLYETYRLNYQQYKEDGELTAHELLDWTRKYVHEPLRLLDWGCGVARVVRHFPALINRTGTVFGADINKKMIDWDSKNISNVNFSSVNYYPPTHFTDSQFNLVFGMSVFTHIEAAMQLKWIIEIHRIIADNGVFLFTTHGKRYCINLTEKEKEKLETSGATTITYRQKGHRMMTTYNKYEHFKTLMEKYFQVLEYYDGRENPGKIGGQDLWIVQKIKV